MSCLARRKKLRKMEGEMRALKTLSHRTLLLSPLFQLSLVLPSFLFVFPYIKSIPGDREALIFWMCGSLNYEISLHREYQGITLLTTNELPILFENTGLCTSCPRLSPLHVLAQVSPTRLLNHPHTRQIRKQK